VAALISVAAAAPAPPMAASAGGAGAEAARPAAQAEFQNLAAAGSDALCGIRTDLSLDCWGRSRLAVSAAPSGPFTAISAARRIACGLRPDATMECWGRWWAQGPADALAQAPAGTYSTVDLAEEQGCAIRTDGSLTCFGWFDSADATRASLPAGTFRAVAAVHHLFGGCAIRTSGELACWGDDRIGQASPPDGTFIDIAAGRMTYCGIRTSGELACWGLGLYGAADAPEGRFTALALGGDTVCAISADDRSLRCWGADLGKPPDGPVASVAIGDTIGALIGTDGRLQTWGETRYWPVWGYGAPRSPEGFSVFRIVSAPPPVVEVGVPLETTLGTTSVSPRPAFTVSSGSLPPGLTLTTDGRLRGTPLVAGSYGPLTVVADNGEAPRAALTFSLEVVTGLDG
jgi:hypothetical protein